MEPPEQWKALGLEKYRDKLINQLGMRVADLTLDKAKENFTEQEPYEEKIGVCELFVFTPQELHKAIKVIRDEIYKQLSSTKNIDIEKAVANAEPGKSDT